MRFKTYFVYILASRPNGPTYIGVTNNLVRRVVEHREARGSKHSRQYNITRLVYYETFEDINAAIAREKTLKKWRREWKDDLITKTNPSWRDLFEEIKKYGG